MLPRTSGLFALLLLLTGCVAASLLVGAKPLPIGTVVDALAHQGDADAEIIVWNLRIPRTLVGIAVGACFGVAGALIQALTRNPLADPGILGVNAGAGFLVTVAIGLFGVHGIGGLVWWALAGAAVTTVAVHIIGAGGRARITPAALVLAGVALSAVLGGISTLLTLIDPDTFSSVRAWGLGSIARVSLADLAAVLPFMLTGLVLTAVMARSLNTMALGDDTAAALGTNTALVRVCVIAAITLLAGTATALTGGLAFVGLMVPHVVRWIVGADQRWILLQSVVAAPILVLAADVLGRIIARPGEIEVGILTAVIGAPVLIALVRRKEASGL